MEDPHRYKVLIWHRKARKTSTAINEIYKQAHLRVGVYWHLFPTRVEAKETVWDDPGMLFNIVDDRLIKKKNESELTVEFKNGSIFHLRGSDDPDRLRGPNPFGIVLDEYDTMKSDVWPTVQPVLAANGGWAWFIGTPKGKTKLYDLYNRGQDPMFDQWKSWRLKASESGIIPADELTEARRTSISEAFYNQEFECEFLEGEGSVFRNVRSAAVALPEAPKIGHLYVIGVDLAKVQDYTVLAVYDRQTNRQVFQDRFNHLEWPFQKKKIIELARHYNNALIYLDATGLGDPIADDLIRVGLAVEPIKFTNESKKELVEKLSIWIEQGKMAFLNLPETLLEFDNYSYEKTQSGRIVYGAKQGYNDDIVMAHALAVWGLQPLVKEIPIAEMTEIQRMYRQKIASTKESDQFLDYEAY